MANAYSLLGFHKSAYEMFDGSADMSNRNNKAKLMVMKKKPLLTKTPFIIKDVRRLKQKRVRPELKPEDFMLFDKEKNHVRLIEKHLIIFNKSVSFKKVEFHLPDTQLKNHWDKIVNNSIGYRIAK